MVVIFGPAIEFPVDKADGCVVAGCVEFVPYDEGRAGVAQPAPVGRRLEESNRSDVDANCVELVGHAPLHIFATNDDLNLLDAAQVADDLGVDPADGSRTCLASRRGCGARRSRSPRAAPIRRACDSQVRRVSVPWITITASRERPSGSRCTKDVFWSVVESLGDRARRRRCGGREGTASCGAFPPGAAGRRCRSGLLLTFQPARAMIRPNGSARNEPPQNSRPPLAGPSWPTRLTAAT